MKKILLSLFLLTISPILSMDELSDQDSEFVLVKERLDHHIEWVSNQRPNTIEYVLRPEGICIDGGYSKGIIRISKETKPIYDEFFESLPCEERLQEFGIKTHIYRIPAKLIKSIPSFMKEIFEKSNSINTNLIIRRYHNVFGFVSNNFLGTGNIFE